MRLKKIFHLIQTSIVFIIFLLFNIECFSTPFYCKEQPKKLSEQRFSDPEKIFATILSALKQHDQEKAYDMFCTYQSELEKLPILHMTVKYFFPVQFIDRILQKNSIPVDIKNKEGKTALHVAATYGNTKAAKVLLYHGADSNSPSTNERNTPLHLAVEFLHPELVYLLLKHHSNLYAQNKNNQIPFILLEKKPESIDEFDYLLWDILEHIEEGAILDVDKKYENTFSIALQLLLQGMSVDMLTTSFQEYFNKAHAMTLFEEKEDQLLDASSRLEEIWPTCLHFKQWLSVRLLQILASSNKKIEKYKKIFLIIHNVYSKDTNNKDYFLIFQTIFGFLLHPDELFSVLKNELSLEEKNALIQYTREHYANTLLKELFDDYSLILNTIPISPTTSHLSFINYFLQSQNALQLKRIALNYLSYLQAQFSSFLLGTNLKSSYHQCKIIHRGKKIHDIFKSLHSSQKKIPFLDQETFFLLNAIHLNMRIYFKDLHSKSKAKEYLMQCHEIHKNFRFIQLASQKPRTCREISSGFSLYLFKILELYFIFFNHLKNISQNGSLITSEYQNIHLEKEILPNSLFASD